MTSASFHLDRQGALQTTMSERGQGPYDSFPGLPMEEVRNERVVSEEDYI